MTEFFNHQPTGGLFFFREFSQVGSAFARRKRISDAAKLLQRGNDLSLDLGDSLCFVP